MGRPSHINMTISVAFITFFSTMYMSIYMLFVPFLAILPDLDHHAGYGRKKLFFKLPFKHRGFTHTLLFIILTMLLINIMSFAFVYTGGNDYANVLTEFYNFAVNTNRMDNIILFILLHGHLLGDVITVQGIPYLYPLIKSNIRIPLFSTSDEPGKYGTTKEMYVNFLFTIINIAAFIYIFMNLGVFTPIFQNFIGQLQSYNLYNLSAIFICQIIFSIYLFWTDIKKTVKHFKDFFSRIIKVLGFLLVGGLISLAISYGVNSVDTSIYGTLQQAPLYITILVLSIFGFFGLHLTKKYLISISYTTSYLINSIYILCMSSFLFFI